MAAELLAVTLEREHHQIDEAIAAYIASPAHGRNPEPLVRAVSALRRHIFLEEELVFPKLRHAGTTAAMSVMLREHAQIWAGLDAIDRELQAGVDDRMVAKHCHELAVRLQHHNLKEERTIYAQADQALADEEAAKLAALLEACELPAGWVCIKARPATAPRAEPSA